MIEKTMIEQLIFILLSIVLFVYIFLKMIKENDTEYIYILAIEAIGIAIDLIILSSNAKVGIIVRLIIYLMAIILPLVIVILEKKNINLIHRIKVLKADMYIAMGNYKKAKDILLNLIEKDNKVYDYHKKLAQIYEKEGGVRKAIEEYVQCIDLNKQDYQSYYRVSTLLVDLERKNEAIEMLNNLVSKKPEYLDASLLLGDLLLENKSYKEAAMIYLNAIKYNPVSYDLNYNLGIVYTMLNDFNNAKYYYEKAAELNHLAYTAKYSLAEIELIYKNLDKAEEYFEQALDFEELNPDCYFELAKINLIKGKKDLAVKYINLAIDLNSKKISEKIKTEPLFMTIRSRISIPFNLEEKEELQSLSEKEKIAKSHLENTTDITTNMGYVGLKNREEEFELEEENVKQKEE